MEPKSVEMNHTENDLDQPLLDKNGSDEFTQSLAFLSPIFSYFDSEDLESGEDPNAIQFFAFVNVKSGGNVGG